MSDVRIIIDGVQHYVGDDVGAVFLHWLRKANKETQMKVFAAIVLEYQVSAHINTKSEEDYLAAINMTHTDRLVHKIVQAAVKMSVVDDKAVYVSVDAIVRHLRDDCDLLLPEWVVYTVLKTMEECLPGSCSDKGNGIFCLHASFNS